MAAAHFVVLEKESKNKLSVYLKFQPIYPAFWSEGTAEYKEVKKANRWFNIIIIL